MCWKRPSRFEERRTQIDIEVVSAYTFSKLKEAEVLLELADLSRSSLCISSSNPLQCWSIETMPKSMSPTFIHKHCMCRKGSLRLFVDASSERSEGDQRDAVKLDILFDSSIAIRPMSQMYSSADITCANQPHSAFGEEVRAFPPIVIYPVPRTFSIEFPHLENVATGFCSHADIRHLLDPPHTVSIGSEDFYNWSLRILPLDYPWQLNPASLKNSKIFLRSPDVKLAILHIVVSSLCSSTALCDLTVLPSEQSTVEGSAFDYLGKSFGRPLPRPQAIPRFSTAQKVKAARIDFANFIVDTWASRSELQVDIQRVRAPLGAIGSGQSGRLNPPSRADCGIHSGRRRFLPKFNQPDSIPPIEMTGWVNRADAIGIFPRLWVDVTSDTAGAGLITQPESALTPELLVENSGHFPSSYLIKDQKDHSLVVYAGIRGHAPPLLNLHSIDNSGVDSRQYWFITCDTCASPSTNVPPGGVFGISCQIETTVFGFCIRRPGVLGNPPVLVACAGEPNQKFNFLRGSI
ncbi:hypothetical protein B0H19DRAFT_1080140 [Mycena capillaripes]|nr:hypothetical protein B0H19DRAFT_1080140 [Mycena capillaripes]